MQVELPQFQADVETFRQAIERGRVSPADRFEMLKTFDPFECIPPALLHAGHLATYALTCGMIDPFDPEQLVKPATYLVPAEGPCRFIDENGDLQSFYLSSDPSVKQTQLDVRDHVRIAPNALCFLTLAPQFRMPAYIGARFNLLIRDVYRGLLVGTGPLVDPGFNGKLSIPIHNFTTNEYIIRAGEGLVYFEFTKLSWGNPTPAPRPPRWLPSPIDNQPPFPASKGKRKTLDDYIAEATGGGPPQNAIGAQIRKLEDLSDKAANRLRLFTAIGVVGIVALVFTSWSLWIAAEQFVAAAQTELRQSNEQIKDRVRALEDEKGKQAQPDGSKLPIKREPQTQPGQNQAAP